jgi:transposase
MHLQGSSLDFTGILLGASRRDFLDLARKRPKSEEWALEWVETIGTLYHLNNRRLNVLEDSVEFKQRDLKLRACLNQIVKKRDRDLQNKKISESWKSPLKSMKNHWFGLTLFADHPEIPMDNG